MLAPGEYQVNSTVSLSLELTIVGSEHAGTIINATNGSDYVFSLSNNAKVRLENLTFRGNDSQTFVWASDLTHVDSLEVISCIFQGGRSHIYLQRNQYGGDRDNMPGTVVIEGCEFDTVVDDSSLALVEIYRAITSKAVVRNNVFRGARPNGLRIRITQEACGVNAAGLISICPSQAFLCHAFYGTSRVLSRGKRVAWRRLSRSKRRAVRRSRPMAKPPWGGAPSSNASR
jgi:hypothetical protein